VGRGAPSAADLGVQRPDQPRSHRKKAVWPGPVNMTDPTLSINVRVEVSLLVKVMYRERRATL
jgi:hypothetical protein